jgi:magnesium-transporting ATPase (P-type)
MNILKLSKNLEEVEENANALEKWENKEEWDNNINGGAKQNQNWAVVQGQQISRLTTQQWDQLILHKQSVVFARTTPEQKLLIVEQCQRRGQIIAMTVSETILQQICIFLHIFKGRWSE